MLHFRKLFFTFVFFSFLAVTSLCLPASAKGQRARHVVVISFDQGGGDAIREAKNMPIFHQMVKEGAHTWKAYTVVPSMTQPSHVSMFTGVGVQAHQITKNETITENKDGRFTVKLPTAFSLAHEKGMSTAMYTTSNQYHRLNIPGSIDHFKPQAGRAEGMAAQFAQEFPAKKHNLSFIYFSNIDFYGHRHGKYSDEWKNALAVTDKALHSVRETIKKAGIEKETVIIMLSDHGAHNITDKDGKKKAKHGTTQTEDVEIPWVVWGKGVKKNYEIERPVLIYDTAATVLWLLGVDIPQSFWGTPIQAAFED